MEHCDSRTIEISVSSQKAELHLGLFGLDDENIVIALVEAELPAKIRDWPLDGYSLAPLGAGNWDVTARYTIQAQDLNDQKDDMASFSFDLTGGTKKVKQSLEVMGTYTRDGVIETDYGGLIGVNGDRIEGAEIPTPQFKFTISGHLPQSLVTLDYVQQLKKLVGKVNEKKFKNFERGEVMFFGAKGGWRGREKAEMSFDFAASENVDDLVIGEGTPHQIPAEGEDKIVKEGWWYLDVHYEDDVDGDAKKLIKLPTQVDVHRVTKYGDFSVMGIGQ
jgi:hypothetical protein